MRDGAAEGQTQKILIVDDEPQIVRVLRTSLASRGYDVRSAADGASGIQLYREWQPDLVITDLSMPGLSGVELCREIRALAATPILVLSVRDQDRSKVEALDAGADDYVTKPFSMDELQARVRAHLRRSAPVSRSDERVAFEVGDFVIDPGAHRVRVRGKEVRLTPKQFDLLVYMARHAGRVLTHRALLTAVWGIHSVDQPEYLRVFIGQLRKKIELGPKPYLLTEPWIGYRFCPDPEQC
jgi:two-component system, OmpR family, KDP operon response regulator KdpE